MDREPIVVIGAGQSGAQIVESLRGGGYQGPLTLVGEEPVLPYQRPPLSKKYLAGDLADVRLLLRPPSFYANLGVRAVLGRRVVSIDRGAREIVLDDGARCAYAGLALATGTRVRPLPVPGVGAPEVHCLRTLADAQTLRAALSSAARVVVIGGGFIGLEVAAVACAGGKRVTVLEAASHLMPRALPAVVAEFFRDLHRGHGVEIITGARVCGIAAVATGGVVVECADGGAHPADLVVVGIGVLPNTELAQDAGLHCDDGVCVDEYARTSDPDIVAAGDCTMHVNVALGTCHRLESVQNAVGQAKVAAATLLGSSVPYAEVPWFWSDQYATRLQMAGISRGHDRYEVRGDIAGAAFSVFYFSGPRLLGVDSVNQPADHMICRRLMSAGVSVTPEQAADTGFDLRSLLRT